jgi:signal transduction histidine kinase
VPDDRDVLERQIDESRSSPVALTHTARHRKKDGTVLHVEITTRALSFNDQFAWITTVHDVTERLRLEEELQRSRKLDGLARLAGGVAHDFNNLLTSILGYTQILANRYAASPEASNELGEIRAAGMHARELTQQLLAFARRQGWDSRVIDVRGLLLDRLALLRRLAGEGVLVDAPLAGDLWAVLADPAQIEQVLINLVMNARDAMGGRGTLSIRGSNVSVPSHGPPRHPHLEPGDYVILEVCDTGAGMSAEAMAHVFEPFFTTKPTGEGTGLGLATVYGVVQQLGGLATVESQPGHGATFRRVVRRSRRAVPATATEHDGPARGGTESVLVVEDDASVRTLAVRLLSQAGYRVAVAASGEEALELGSRGEPLHLLVTDLVMPRLGGHEVARRLGSAHPEMRVLYVSGYAAHDNGGAVDAPLLAKPFTPAALLGKVREVLDAPWPPEPA